MELWDVLDAEGNKTGRTMVRGERCKAGEYHLAVHIYIINSKGEFLIQKRSEQKKLYPGMWDVTGGAVVAGEDSLTSAFREVEEELGISLPPEKFFPITRLYRSDYFIDVWGVFADIPLEDVVMQEDEVDDVKYVSGEEMIRIVFGDSFKDQEYRTIMEEYVKSLAGQPLR